MKDLTIGEVARYAGIQTSAIRYYEREGLLPPPRRVNGRDRRYDLSVLKRLGLIQLLREAGFGIRELQVLFGDVHTDAPDSTQWRALAAAKVAELEALLMRVQTTREWLTEALQRGCKNVEECVSIAVDERGQGMSVTLSCLASLSESTHGTTEPMTLMTMGSEHEP
jgi:DNA-binding transcriptional MerR regulator